MIQVIITLLIGLIVGGIGVYFWAKPRIRVTNSKNEENIKYNEELSVNIQEKQHYLDQLLDTEHDIKLKIDLLHVEKQKIHDEYQFLTNQIQNLSKNKNELQSQELTLIQSCTELRATQQELGNAIVGLKEQATESAKVFEEQAIALAETNIEHSIEKMRELYSKAEQEYFDNYQILIAECAKELDQQANEKKEEIEKYNLILLDLMAKTSSAVEAAKRAEQQRTANDFYRLQLSDEDIAEIKRLREVSVYLRDSEPLNKIIWKVYYEKPYTDLVGRVIGSGVHTGIYKITNIKNQMCYVGQAVKIGR